MNLFKITFGTPNESFIFIDETKATTPEFLGFFENREELIKDNFFQAFANMVESQKNILEENKKFIIEIFADSGDVRNVDAMEISIIPENELQEIQRGVRIALGEELPENENKDIENKIDIHLPNFRNN